MNGNTNSIWTITNLFNYAVDIIGILSVESVFRGL